MGFSRPRRWDWPSAILMFFMLQAATARLIITQWTEYLFFAQTLAAFGLILGLALGYSQFKRRTVAFLTLGYSILLIPWQLTLAINDVLLSERLASVGGRLFFSATQFFQRVPVEDGLMFVAFISIIAWCISVVSGYWWARHQNYLVAVLPGGIFALVIHLYDQYFSSRIWLLAIYLLLALFLLGHLYYQKSRESWQERRVFQMQESTFDLTRGMVITASLFIFIAWTVPASQAGVDSFMRTWKRITEPWRDVQESLSYAVEGLEAPSPSNSVDLYGSQLWLGGGNPLSEEVVFSVEAPALSEKQPRYYWRGYVYDDYQDQRWKATGSISAEFSPESTELLVPDIEGRTVATFIFRTQIPQFLLYTATQPVWVSRPGKIQYGATGTAEQDLFAWRTEQKLSAGEQYQVSAALTNPSIQQLQKAGTEYPQWVTDRYLQLPEDMSARIINLAYLITQGLETPYDQTQAITSYLRRAIVYTNPLPESPPEGQDPLEWVLFDIKKGFCNYYASAEVLMLRSLGIPARMAVGFSEGDFDDEDNVYIVRSLDAHAWPEVYFPGIGWIEFEPTGNQDPLERPDIPEENLNPLNAGGGLDNAVDPSGSGDGENPFDRRNNFDEDPTGIGVDQTVIDEQQAPNQLYYYAIAVTLLGIFWLLNSKYAVIERFPVQLQTAFERNGGQSPAWLDNWVHWSTLTPIERSFETINHSLRLLGETPAFHATPAERANLLTKRLPKAQAVISTLTEQHQASLFTPSPGNTGKARRASLLIRLYTIQNIVQKLLYGHPLE